QDVLVLRERRLRAGLGVLIGQVAAAQFGHRGPGRRRAFPGEDALDPLMDAVDRERFVAGLERLAVALAVVSALGVEQAAGPLLAGLVIDVRLVAVLD